MKKIISFILMLTLCLSLFACSSKSGGANDGNNVNQAFNYAQYFKNVNFSMTINDIKSLETSKLTSSDATSLQYSGYLAGYSGEYVYRFYESTGTLYFVKFFFDDTASYVSYMQDFKLKHGEPEKLSGDFQFWYGQTNGVEMYFCGSYSTIDGYANISVAPVSNP